jgi:hypothetical protein
MSNDYPLLPEPMELLDLEHGNSIQLRIDRYDMGTTDIHPTNVTRRHVRLYMNQQSLTAPPAPGTPITVRIPVLRVYGQRLDEPSPQTYWDISSKRLIADLRPRLYAMGGNPLVVKLTAEGYKPTKRYSVEV